MKTDRAIAAYSAVGVETAVAGASPQRLILMLYDGALGAMHSAKAALARKDVAARGTALSKAIAIIDEGLRPALDLQAGGEIAGNLMALYEYVTHRLLYANLKGHEPSIDEAAHLMTELRDSWEALERQSRAESKRVAEERAPARAVALSYGMV